VADSVEDAWVGRYRDLLPVRIDIPKPVDSAREILFVLLAELNGWLAQSRQRPRKISVFYSVLFFGL
jgi:hypothetical protein